VIEFARSEMGIADANSEEFGAQGDNQVLVFMPEISRTHMGGACDV